METDGGAFAVSGSAERGANQYTSTLSKPRSQANTNWLAGSVVMKCAWGPAWRCGFTLEPACWMTEAAGPVVGDQCESPGAIQRQMARPAATRGLLVQQSQLAALRIHAEGAHRA